jgi:hypothetical protein
MRNRVAILFVAVVLCSCDAQYTSEAPGPPEEISAADAGLLHDAEQHLIAKCMRTLGFRYWPDEQTPAESNPVFPYVVDDVDWARKHGYGRDLEAAVDADVGTTPNERYFKELPADRRAAALAALNGNPPADDAGTQLTAQLPSGGTVHRSARSCTSTAQRTLYADLSRWFEVTRVTEDLVSLRQAMVHQDAHFTTAVEAWSRCMHAAGFPVGTPGQARDSLPPAGTDAARRAEIATATAEAVCATSTPLASVAGELDAHYRQVLRDRYRTEFADRSRLRTAALPRARSALSSP